MVSRTLPVLLLFLISPAFGQTAEQKPAAGQEKPSMLGSFLDAGMPDEVLFAVRKPSIDGHWYANIAYYSTDQCRTTFPMNSGGKLCIYNVKTKEVRTIFEDPEGNIRDPQIHYDAQKLIFAYLPKGKRHYSLYEINLDGTGLKQLTGRGEDVSPGMEDYTTYSPPGWDDFEPTYLPDGQIIFCSTRANRYVQCWMTQVGNAVQVRRRRKQHPRAVGQCRTRQHALGARQRSGRVHALGIRGPLSHGLSSSLVDEPRRHPPDGALRQPDQPRHDPGPEAGSAQPEARRDVVARPRHARALRQDRAHRSATRTGRPRRAFSTSARATSIATRGRSAKTISWSPTRPPSNC